MYIFPSLNTISIVQNKETNIFFPILINTSLIPLSIPKSDMTLLLLPSTYRLYTVCISLLTNHQIIFCILYHITYYDNNKYFTLSFLITCFIIKLFLYNNKKISIFNTETFLLFSSLYKTLFSFVFFNIFQQIVFPFCFYFI